MPNRYDNAVSQLESIKSANSTNTNLKQLRHHARNVIEIYGDQEFRNRFDGMVKFRIHDARPDHERKEIVIRAIDNAIHFFKIKSQSMDSDFEFAGDAIESDKPSGGVSKFLSFLLVVIVVVLTFLIFNNLAGFVWHLTGIQYLIIAAVIALFAFNFFKHKVDDKWLAVSLAILPLILQIILKKLGVEL
jgi:hypothetical protein